MRIGTRGSALALKQTALFIESLQEKHPKCPYETIIIETRGDIDGETPLGEMGGFGAFVHELDNCLLNEEVDVSVNSLKDMPVTPREGVVIAAVLPRVGVEDVIIPCSLDQLRAGSRIGTSSTRRAAMVKKLRPDLETVNIRGNVITRLGKLAKGQYDAIILARAGVERLGLEMPYFSLPIGEFTPAPGQGAIAMACREDDEETYALLQSVNHGATYDAVMLERKLMELLEGDFSSPVGIYVSYRNERMHLEALSLCNEGLESRHHSDFIDRDDSDSLSRIADHLKEVL